MTSRLLLTAGILAAGVAPGLAQCNPAWTAFPGPVLDDEVKVVKAWDPDGPGPAREVLLLGGNFRGATVPRLVAAWDGASLTALGAGVDGTVGEISLFDPDGPGPLGLQPILGGWFVIAGGLQANHVGRWDGTMWHTLGSGLSGSAAPSVEALAPFGPDLFVTGVFHLAGGIPANFIARWDGANWHALPDERAGAADVLTIHNGELYAGGSFANAGFTPPVTGVLRWTGSAWANLGPNAPYGTIFALATFRGELYAGGTSETGQYIFAFDGQSWRTLGLGTNARVLALCVFDPDGPGPLPERLIAGGHFGGAGGQVALGVAAWDGAQWSPLGPGVNAPVQTLTVWNNQLVVGGFFSTAGGLFSPFLAFWGCPQTQPCYPNCDGSSAPTILNVNDFVCFTQRFAARDPYANCDHSTEPQPLNIADFVCFMQTFAAGCP